MTISKPLSAIFIGSFDLLTGIRLCYQWNFGSLIEEQLESIAKITLSNVHRQEQTAFENGSISTIELQCYQCTVITLIYKQSHITKINSCAYISVGIVLNTNILHENEELKYIYIFWTRFLGNLIKNLVDSNRNKTEISNIDFSPLNHIISRISYESTFLFTSQIISVPSLMISPHLDITFFSNALTSHLQTQMTTILEFPYADETTNMDSSHRRSSLDLESSPSSDPLACFLANFTLPYQRKLSSLKLLPNPINGLFLQCVSAQKISPEEYLSNSIRPTTWIRIQDQKIFRTHERYFVDQYQNALHSTFLSTDQQSGDDNSLSPYSLKSIKLIYSKKFKKDQSHFRIILQPAPFVKGIVSKLIQCQKHLRNLGFEQSLNSIVRQAFCLITVKNDKLNGADSLNLDQIHEIQHQVLNITNNDDFLVIISIAEIFDHNTYKQMSSFLSIPNK